MAENLLIVFAKYPEPDQVKSRLAVTLGSGRPRTSIRLSRSS